jgi:hypothetical protein
MDATRTVGERRTDASVRLSSAEKRDIASMFVAATITAGLIVAPAVAPRDQYVTLLASRSVPSLTSAPLTVDSRFESPVVNTPRPSVRASGTTRRTAPIATTSTPPTWNPSRITTTLPAVVAVNENLETPVVVTERLDAPRKPLARRLAGFFTGDGTHTIRPFPTVSTER